MSQLWDKPRIDSASGDCRTILCSRISDQLETWRTRIKTLLANSGEFKVCDVTINQIYGGIRGVMIQVSDISYVDPYEGIRIRGYTVPELLEILPKAPGHRFPLAGGLYFLLMTNTLPTIQEALLIEQEWKRRMDIPEEVYETLRQMPRHTHPMTLLSMGLLAMQNDSTFSYQYAQGGLKKDEYWEFFLEDSLTLTARIPVLAAFIYNQKYRGGKFIPPNPDLDWSANFASMIGKGDDEAYQDLCRLFFLIHSDHEGGNVSAHAAHLASSALSDVYLACSAGMNGLAGPLHGLANQECIRWLLGVQKKIGECPTQSELENFLRAELAAGRVIPGYGHAVLRTTDPRFTVQKAYADEVMPDDPLFRLVSMIYNTLPPLLMESGKVKNPWPNVDALNGTLQRHFGMVEDDFYTVLFGVSRVLGITAHCTWARVLNKPIERPKSLTTTMLEDMVSAAEEGRAYEVSTE